MTENISDTLTTDQQAPEQPVIDFSDLSPIERARRYGALLSMDDVAAYLAVPTDTVAKWRERHKGPKARLVGRHLRYRLADVDEWIDSIPLG